MATPADERLARAWRALLRPFAAADDAVDGELTDLLARHREAHRHYHTTEHLTEALAAVDALADLTDDATPVRLAVWYHDAVYDPRSSTSEAQSATLARERLPALGVPDETVTAVAGLVEGTAGHRPERGDRNGCVLTDADLWILGSDVVRYRRYADDVRAEYAHLDDERWRSGRRAVLEDFLGRARIYTTDRFHTELDSPARRNLAEERRHLGK